MKIILVGGFLGAGKTTLLSEAARRLSRRGDVVGLITNDQAPDLVDTALLSRSGASVREVAGSCFCCNFDGFRDAAAALHADGAEIVIAEPVGSCTDLAATIVRPMQALHPETAMAPLSVLIDPARVRDVLQETAPSLHADAVYILHKQLEEAERILVSKVDLLSDSDRREIVSFLESEFPGKAVHLLSATTGEGVDGWLEDVVAGESVAAALSEIDYDRYAEGEAVLGWLNAVVELESRGGAQIDWERVTQSIMDAIHARLRETENEIGHLKVLLTTSQGQVAANLTGLGEGVELRSATPGDAGSAAMTLNARVQISPKRIERVVRYSLIQVCSQDGLTSVIRAFHCLQPGRPVPTHRMSG